MPWDDIWALAINHLIVLEKCPDVHPFDTGETVCHVIAFCVRDMLVEFMSNWLVVLIN